MKQTSSSEMINYMFPLQKIKKIKIINGFENLGLNSSKFRKDQLADGEKEVTVCGVPLLSM